MKTISPISVRLFEAHEVMSILISELKHNNTTFD